MKSIIQLDPASYRRHLIHQDGRIWAETNCYVDVLIELIHALGHEPIAGLAFTVAVDFEVDQWTFFKYQHRDLLNLYGMQVEELNPWRNLAQHVEAQVEAGRPVLVELDSYYLPDTQGTAYKLAHVKSTVAVNEIDIEARHMGYFHGQGYYHVDGEDFDKLFQLGGLVHERMLPPYIELVKLKDAPREKDVLEQSLASAKLQARLIPEYNPFHAFRGRFAADLEWLTKEPIETFHLYSFATLRQFGANYELAGTYADWLSETAGVDLSASAAAYREIAESTKVFQFKLARSLARGKTLDLGPLDDMASHWQEASDRYRSVLLD